MSSPPAIIDDILFQILNYIRDEYQLANFRSVSRQWRDIINSLVKTRAREIRPERKRDILPVLKTLYENKQVLTILRLFRIKRIPPNMSEKLHRQFISMLENGKFIGEIYFQAFIGPRIDPEGCYNFRFVECWNKNILERSIFFAQRVIDAGAVKTLYCKCRILYIEILNWAIFVHNEPIVKALIEACSGDYESVHRSAITDDYRVRYPPLYNFLLKNYVSIGRDEFVAKILGHPPYKVQSFMRGIRMSECDVEEAAWRNSFHPEIVLPAYCLGNNMIKQYLKQRLEYLAAKSPQSGHFWIKTKYFAKNGRIDTHEWICRICYRNDRCCWEIDLCPCLCVKNAKKCIDAINNGWKMPQDDGIFPLRYTEFTPK